MIMKRYFDSPIYWQSFLLRAAQRSFSLWKASFGCVAGALLFFGCDTQTAAPIVIQPQIKIEFVQPIVLQGISAKSKMATQSPDAVWDVALTVKSKGGRDYSPVAKTVDDATTDQVSFDLSLPADTTFTFGIVYSQNGQRRAEGQVVQRITSQSQQVLIPVNLLSSSSFNLSFSPSVSIIRPSNTPQQLILKLDGAPEALKALACKLQVSGIDLTQVRFRHAISVRQSDGYDLAWTWIQGKTAPFVVDTLDVPVSQSGDFRFLFKQGNLQALSNSNRILTLTASDARILVRP